MYSICAMMTLACTLGPRQGHGLNWIKAFFKRYSRLTLLPSRIFEVNRVTSDDQSHMEAFYNALETLFTAEKPDLCFIWITDESGKRDSSSRLGRYSSYALCLRRLCRECCSGLFFLLLMLRRAISTIVLMQLD